METIINDDKYTLLISYLGFPSADHVAGPLFDAPLCTRAPWTVLPNEK